MQFLRDTWLIYTYALRATLRNSVFVFVGFFNPLCYLFLFMPLLKGLAKAGYFEEAQTLSFFLPGLLVIMSMYGSVFVGFELIDKLKTGFVERLWVTPVSRLALIMGRVLRDSTVLLFQSLSLIGVAYLSGLDASLPGVLLSLILVLLVGIVFSSFSYMLALAFKEEEALGASINFFLLPIELLSGFILPLTLAPVWLKRIAYFNPLSYVITGSRALFLGKVTDAAVFTSFGLMVVFVGVVIYTLAYVYKKRAV